MIKKLRLVIFASGTADGGGSGFRELMMNARTGVLNADIRAVISNHEYGGVRKFASEFNVPFIYFPGPYTADEYQKLVYRSGGEWVALSGWLKLVKGLNPRMTFNIHPGPLPQFGGKGMYGHNIHKAVIEAFKKGEIKYSAVTMHFVTNEYDKGPVFFRYPVLIQDDDTPEILAEKVQQIEHAWQSFITNLVVHGDIYWDGKNPATFRSPLKLLF